MELQEQKITSKENRLLPFLMIFTIGGIFGFIYEELFYLIDLGYLVKRGTTFGPWIPIYGFGAVLIVLTANRLRKHPVAAFVVSTLVCGTLEYITGYVLLKAVGVRLWDYNTEIWNWGNIGGFICARSVLFFGFSALFLLYLIYPFVLRLREKCGKTAFCIISVLPALLFALDIVISLIYRWAM